MAALTASATLPVDYDVLVVGAGPGGYVAAIRAAQLGLKVGCVDSRAALGGTCLNVGCIPSKALLHASDLYAGAKSGALAAFGIHLDGARLDLEAMHGQRRDTVKSLTEGIASLFRKNGVERLEGHAAFSDSRTMTIGDHIVRAGNIVLATGSSVTALPGVQIDGAVVIDSTTALELPEVPGHLVVIGGGAIGLELGSVWQRLGARVTVVELNDNILLNMDHEVRTAAATLFRKQGLVLRTGTRIVAVQREGKHAQVTLEPVAGGAVETMTADAVLVATGRRPNTDGLALDTIGLSLDSGGRIVVDARFATQVPGVWAIGDVIAGPMLAHKAEDEGIAVAEIIAGLPGMVNHDIIPNVVYTNPEFAGVGLTEEQAAARGEITVGRFPFAANSRARANLDVEGFVKIVADATTDRVLGVHIVSSLAGTLIAQAAQAMEFGATSVDIAYTCHAHPTHAEALKEAAMAVRGAAIHL